MYSLDELVLKLHEHSNHVKCTVCDSCTLVMLRWWWVGIFLTSQRQWRILCRSVCFYSWKIETALERQPSCGGSQLHFSIYNAFYAPLLCKRGMMKRISSLRNGIPAAPPPPHGHGVLLEVQHCAQEENPLHSNLVELTYTWPFDISCVSSML